jgi:restriction modification system DNA specificity domain protein
MKESGIDWIGQIPEEWKVTKLKYVLLISNGKDYKDIEVEEGGYPVIGSGGVFARARNYMYDGDVVLLGRKGTIDKPLFYSGKFWTVDTMFYSTALNGNNIKFMYYSSLLIPFSYYSTATALPSMTQSDLNNHVLCLPSISEQQKIADFLDKKTAQLDKAKELLEEQIQKLKDYRASLIYETVTKGLDKTVPMKDSGIDWIGQVPEGWGVKRLKDYVDFQTGTTPPQSIGVNQERKGVRWFKPGDFSDESVDLTSAENYITSEVVNQQKLSVYPEKTILVVGIASIGKVGYSESHSYSNQQITALKVTGQIFPKYLAYLMFSSGQYIRETALYTIVPIINNQYLSSLKIVLPNLEEQESIVEYLDRQIMQINKMITIKNQQIENINKQRQTLIYDYVTGKRRV